MLVRDQSKIDSYYKALVERRKEYVGIFYVGVKTTSVFCIATCRARKPKRKNVEFYTTFKEALENGYRPCKICKPTQNTYEVPTQVKKAIELLKENPKLKISDRDLSEKGIQAVNVRRWFKKNYGITFQAFQRMYKLNDAYLELRKGKQTTHTAYNAGYESLSGFSYTYKRIMGHNPSLSKTEEILHCTRLTSPLGPILICASSIGIVLCEFANQETLRDDIELLKKKFSRRVLMGENDHLSKAKVQLQEYFLGSRFSFDLPLAPQGTNFQQSVWKELLQIDYGHTRSYKEHASKLGNSKAVRAVGNANAKNKIAIIIPCHRVLGSSGSLTGYSGGIERKRWLLRHELANKSKVPVNS